jgi:GPI mannosyltransferase 1 subunit M
VFTDAAREVWQGNSPYDRATYRYTPVLAWLLVPNVFARVWGKLVFCSADLIIAVLLHRILSLRGVGPREAALYTAAFLWHPFTINVSSRGNADSIVCATVLLTLYLLLQGRDIAAAVAYAAAVHLKIYPIIYALPIVFFLDAGYAPQDFSATAPPAFARLCGILRARGGCAGRATAATAEWLRQFLTWRRVRFGLISGGLFLLSVGLLYCLYGDTFVYETYLYHFVRADNRHNFSPYFYDLYLRYDEGGGGGALASRTVSGILAFLPQFGTIFFLGAWYYRDLPFAMLIQV